MSGGEAFPGVCTDWHRHDVPAMWQMLAGEDGQHSWDQVTGWRQISELLNLHSGRLRVARDQLAASWPARGSRAAGVFLAFVDQLLASMDGTATAAAGNSVALAGITTSLGKAREAMEQLHNEWQRYAEAERQNNRPMIRGASPGVLEPRPPQDWRQELNRQGATVMTAMENEVLDYAQSTTVPETYEPVQPRDGGRAFPSGEGASSYPQLTSKYRAHEGLPESRLTPNGNGPLLSGFTSQSSELPAIPGAVMPPDDAPTAISSTRPPPLVVEPMVTSWSRNTLSDVGRKTSMRNVTEAHSASAQPTRGDFIEEPDSKSAMDPRRIEQKWSPSAQPAPANTSGVSGGGGSSNSNVDRRARQMRTSLVEQWRTSRGVPPVLEPTSRRDRHSPGPGVLGIDR